MILVVSILFFAAVTVLVAGLVSAREEARAVAISRRLKERAVTTPGPHAAAARDLRLSVIPWLDRVLQELRIGERTSLLLYQASLNVKPGVLILSSAAAAAVGALAGLLMLHRPLIALAFFAVGAAAPWALVQARRSSRKKAFLREFPDALSLLVSALRGGLSFSAALQVVAEESAEPIRSEFAIAVEEQALGLDFREAMENLSRRVDTLEVRFFVTAVMLQRETGGNLAEVLGNTASLIRERFRVLADIQTLTAQGRLTGAILVALPLVMGLGLWLASPEYFGPMLESAGGRTALWVAAGMQLAGIFVCWRIVDIKV